MSQKLTEHDGRRALRDHLLEKAAVARAAYGPIVGVSQVLKMLEDREVVRYPVRVCFEGGGLLEGEFAHAAPIGEHPRDGFCLYLHPALECQPALLPLLIAYYIPAINYGDIAAPEDCEAFGAGLLGMDIDAYYDVLCDAADHLPPCPAQTETQP